MSRNNITNYLCSVAALFILASCGQRENGESENGRADLRLGMSVSEVQQFLDANGVELYFENKNGRYVALDKEYEEQLSHPIPSSPMGFFMYRLEFDENNELHRANLEVNGRTIELGEPITLDLEPLNQEAEQ